MPSPWERVIQALYHEESDRVPWGGDSISQPTADAVLRRPALTGMGGRNRVLSLLSRGKIEEVRRRLVEDTYDLVQRLRMDLVAIGRLPAKVRPNVKMLSQNRWIDGNKVFYSTNGNLLSVELDPETGFRKKHDMADLESLVDEMESESSELEEQAQAAIDDLSPLIRRLKEELRVAVLFPCWNCFLTHPDWLATFVKAFHIRPDLVERFERAAAREVLAVAPVAIDSGCDIIGIGGDLAYRKGPMIPPEMYRRFILPHMREESRIVHKRGGFTMIASDGNLMPIADDYFLKTEIDAVREIEPGPMDRLQVKERFGHLVCLNGNVDCGRVLGLGSSREVVADTLDCIASWSPGGGHIISSSNAISPGVKPSNFFAMWKAISKYGRR